jgi:hypothetical protein
MGQGDQTEIEIFPGHVPFTTNDLLEFISGEELANRQTADGNHKAWSQDGHLGLEPFRTPLNLYIVRHAVTACWVLARETTAYGCHVNSLPEISF